MSKPDSTKADSTKPDRNGRFRLQHTANFQYSFDAARNNKKESVVRLSVDGVVSVNPTKVSLSLRSLAAHSRPYHKEPGKYSGPNPIVTVLEVVAKSGTAGFPRCSRGPSPARMEVDSEGKRVLRGGLDEIGGDMHGGHVKTGPTAESESKVHTKQAFDKVKWRPGLDGEYARYSGSAEGWSDPKSLKKHPTITDVTTRYDKWRDLPYPDSMAGGFANTEIDHVIEWDRSEDKHEEVKLDIKLSGKAGTLRRDRKLFHKPFLWQVRVVETPMHHYTAKVKVES